MLSADLFPVSTAVYQAISGPFRGDWGSDTYKHHITHGILRKVSSHQFRPFKRLTIFQACLRLSTAQLQFIGPPFSTVYEQFCKAKGITPNIVTLKSGIKGFWVGDPAAKTVVIYYHGT